MDLLDNPWMDSLATALSEHQRLTRDGEAVHLKTQD